MINFIKDRLFSIQGKTQKLKYVFLNTFGSNCTNRCYMCPLRTFTGKNHPMSDETFKKAISQLREIDFDGELHLYSQNEPFMDKNIFEKIDYISKNLPKAEIAIISNFTILDDEKIDKILNSEIKYFSCSIYALLPKNYEAICNRDNFKRSFTNQVKFMKEYAKNPKLSFALYLMNDIHNRDDMEFCKFFIFNIAPARRVDFYETFSFFNTNHLPQKLNNHYFSKCIYDHLQIINDGDVSICSIDAASDLKVGNIYENSIKDLVNNEHAKNLRKRMIFSSEKDAFCRYCDFHKSENAYFYFLPIPEKLRAYLNKKFIDSFKYNHNVKTNSNEEIFQKAMLFNQIFKDGDEENWINCLYELRRKFYAKEL